MPLLDKLVNHSSTFEPVPDSLVRHVIGRNTSFFEEDMEKNSDSIALAIRGHRVLVLGAAGSIGAAVVKALLVYNPRSIALVDISENNLADLVRRLRASATKLPSNFSTSVVAVGSHGFERYFSVTGPFDLVLNFAALKHVRSERDPFSLMRLLETNVSATDQLVHLVRAHGGRLFSVSSDKAVYPASLMGASKRWMELLLAAGQTHATSSRFANVAFSAGSLLQSFKDRLLARQPIGAPNDVSRYFISHREAAELCILAATLGRPGEVFLPKLVPQRDLIEMRVAAERFLNYFGLMPELHVTEDAAKSSMQLSSDVPTAWPCVFSASDTAGEKKVEEFHYADEVLDESRFNAVAVAGILKADPARLAAGAAALSRLQERSTWRKADLASVVAQVVPQLSHIEQTRSLDTKL